jgi:cation:H+ antiporter
MAGAAVLFLVSALTIIAAGSLLTRFADKLSEQTGLGRFLIGGILLAGATSMPEIIVDLNILSPSASATSP